MFYIIKMLLCKYCRMKNKQNDHVSIARVAVASSMIDISYKVLTAKNPYNA